MRVECVSRCHGNGPLNHALQLPDIAWPGMAHQSRLRRVTQNDVFLAELLRVHTESVIRKQQDVLLSVSERGQCKRQDIQPVEQIFTKLPRLNEVTQIRICGSNDLHIDRLALG